jgi:Carbohydrate-selective porin, OprB family/S-layer homology domain
VNQMNGLNGLAVGLGCVVACAQSLPAAGQAVPTPDCIAWPEYAPDVQVEGCVTATNAAMEQVRSVAEFSDVTPRDWAYGALRDLSQRYGVPAGFPDRTFRGDRPLTRAEFAGAMAQLLTNWEQLLRTGQIVPLKEDLVTLQRLQATYGAIAVDLRDRLTRIEALMQHLEGQQFSTTSKLSGQVVLDYTDGNRARGVLVSRTRLNLNTSFSPTDTLVTQLEAGNGKLDAVAQAQNRGGSNQLGTVGVIADGGGLDYVQVPDTVQLRKLYYRFQPLENLSVAIGPRLSPRDFVDANRFANDSAENFSSSFFANNPLTIQNQVDRPGGAGIAVAWQPSKTLPLMIRGVYAAADGDRANATASSQGGLFGDRHQATLEAEYSLRQNLTLRTQFTQAKINGTNITAVGLNGEWAVNPFIGVFGRFAWGRYDGFNSVLQQDLHLTPFSWAIGATLQDFLVPGTTAGLALGQPFVDKGLGDATQTNIEGFVKLLVNDNISLTPGLIVVIHPDNESSRGTVWQWFARIVYTF